MKIQKGQQVTLYCSSYLEDGQCLDPEPPEQVTVVAGNKTDDYLSTTVSTALVGMADGETKSLKISGEHIFGAFDPMKILKIEIEPSDEYYVGRDLELSITTDGKEETVEGSIIKVEGNEAMVDINHPLCNENILLKIEVVSFA